MKAEVRRSLVPGQRILGGAATTDIERHQPASGPFPGLIDTHRGSPQHGREDITTFKSDTG